MAAIPKSVTEIDGFESGDGLRFRAIVMQHLQGTPGGGGDIKSALQRLVNEATDGFLDAQARGELDQSARYGLAALSVANMLSGIAYQAVKGGHKMDEQLLNLFTQERAAGDALLASLGGVSQSIAKNMEPFLSQWKASPIAQSDVLSAKVRGPWAVCGQTARANRLPSFGSPCRDWGPASPDPPVRVLTIALDE